MDLSGTSKENYRYVSHNRDNRPELNELLKDNTTKTNEFVAKSMMFFAVVNVFWMINSIFSWSDITPYVLLLLGISTALLVGTSLITKHYGLSNKWVKEILIGTIILSCVILRVCFNNIMLMLFIFPVILSTRYYDDNFTLITSGISGFAGIIAIIITVYVDINYGYIDTGLLAVEEPFRMGVSGSFGASIINSSIFDKSAYASKAILFYTFNFITIMIPLSFVCYRVANNGKRLIIDVSLMQREKDNAVQEVQESKMEIMISQIQPHFLYNALNSIYYLVDKDQKKAKQAIADFSDYLRANLNFSKESGLVPFTQELEHIKKYLALEKVRFEDDLNIEYDIKTTSFRVPSLTLQPLCENAVKHGISKKNGGGTLTIATKEEHDNYLITIKDDGVGFDQYKKKEDNRRHIGLENSRFRLRELCNASIDVNSEIGVGTTIKIRIPKEYYYEDTSSR